MQSTVERAELTQLACKHHSSHLTRFPNGEMVETHRKTFLDHAVRPWNRHVKSLQPSDCPTANVLFHAIKRAELTQLTCSVLLAPAFSVSAFLHDQKRRHLELERSCFRIKGIVGSALGFQEFRGRFVIPRHPTALSRQKTLARA